LPGPFFTFEALNETEGLRLLILSDSTLQDEWADPHANLISGIYRKHTPAGVFKTRVINYSVRKYVMTVKDNCYSDSKTNRDFNNILKAFTAFSFCKHGDSIGVMFVEKEFSGFNSHVRDSCVIRLRVP